ncbi:hypothetical protein [Amycolatopsis panacis]|uniref:hypothetical protein n=1 Tax=Amycolatopsis panacis TaxID=2340917 RepID=UPI0011C371C2|nr:hypothetical protein [Amycolatopsis panacis]
MISGYWPVRAQCTQGNAPVIRRPVLVKPGHLGLGDAIGDLDEEATNPVKKPASLCYSRPVMIRLTPPSRAV